MKSNRCFSSSHNLKFNLKFNIIKLYELEFNIRIIHKIQNIQDSRRSDVDHSQQEVVIFVIKFNLRELFPYLHCLS